ncbi:MAG: hypothetical protein HYU29_07840 [Chloroflexi bacterium]|nr:hypothetical protein [Chloroflexota bacterium]
MATVTTVLGPIDSSQMGITMSHVHLTLNLLCFFRPPDSAYLQGLSESKITLQNLGLVRRNATLFKDNLLQDDLDLATKEAAEYRYAGGQTMVCLDLPGMGRDPLAMQRVSRATGLHIVASTGWYLQAAQPPELAQRRVEELAEAMVKEITEGIGDTGVRAGNIGELGMSGLPHEPFQPGEEKALRAAARAQKATGVSLTIHPNTAFRAPPLHDHLDTYLDVLEREGADLSRCYMSHMTMYPVEAAKRVLRRGLGFVSYDEFGHEEFLESVYGPGLGFPPDKEEVRTVLELLHAGYASRVLLASEVAFKTTYKAYGGWGYSHLLENILPWLRALGVSPSEIHTMTVENPRRLHALG